LRVRERTLRPGTTLGLGTISLALLLVLALSGVLLMVYYVPTPRDAYASMLDIEHLATFGAFVRRVHLCAAYGLVLCVPLHLLRVCGCAAYRRRTLNWWIGLSLLGLVLALAFTGYLLPWDQRAYWAVQVVTSVLRDVPVLGSGLREVFVGGDRVSAATLLRFYTLHVALLPGVLAGLCLWHLWRIRRDGGLAAPEGEQEAAVSAVPHLTLREGVVLLATTSLVLLSAMALDAALGPPADLLHPDNPEKAPWYFIGFQEMISFSTLAGGLVFPAVAGGLLLLAPLIDRGDRDVGRMLGGPGERRVLGLIAVLATALVVAVEDWFVGHPGVVEQWSPWTRDLVNPPGILLLAAAASFVVGGRATGRVRTGVRAALVVLVVALVGFSVVGACRGPDWVFAWPWQEWPRVH